MRACAATRPVRASLSNSLIRSSSPATCVSASAASRRAIGIVAVGDQLETDRDGGQRRTQLMARVGAELALGGHQLGDSLATFLQRLGDRVDLHEAAARRDDTCLAGADLHRGASEAIEWAAQLARLEARRPARRAAAITSGDRDDDVPGVAHTAIDRRPIGRHGRRKIPRALHVDRHDCAASTGPVRATTTPVESRKHDFRPRRGQALDIGRRRVRPARSAIGERDDHRLGLCRQAQPSVGADLLGEEDAAGHAGNCEDRHHQRQARTNHATTQPGGHGPRFARPALEG